MNDLKTTKPVDQGTSTGDSITKRIEKLEAEVKAIKEKVNLDDRSVSLPQKKNYNPDYLPTGGKPCSLDDLPPLATSN